MKARSFFSMLSAFFPAVLGAQQAMKADPSYRDPGTATIYAVVLPGGGQLYSGETTRGLMLLGGSSAAILAGTALSSEASCKYDSGSAYGVSCEEANHTPLAIGMLASLGIWGYGIFDARKSAERQNLKRTQKALKIEPIFRRVASRNIVGLNVGF